MAARLLTVINSTLSGNLSTLGGGIFSAAGGSESGFFRGDRKQQHYQRQLSRRRRWYFITAGRQLPLRFCECEREQQHRQR